ncbi:MAG: hypothetical protein PHI12_10295 [Dehalococcoidales bacterium]|nr:hypothetical protein [Dehalococcoidales bacterium]
MKPIWENAVTHLRQELVSSRDKAVSVASNLDMLSREAECLKIDIILHDLKTQQQSEERQRGLASITQDKRTLPAGLAIGIGSAILGGLIGRDLYSALHAGVAGVDGLIRGLGETRWYVSLTGRLVVVPEDRLNPEVIWMPWKRVVAGLEKLKKRASAGERMGGLSSITDNLRKLSGQR